MSLTELAPQKPKEYNEHNVRKQDHGDAAAERDLQKYRDERADPYDLRGVKKKDKEHLQAELENREEIVTDDLFNLSPAQLEAAANQILSGSRPYATQESAETPYFEQNDPGYFDEYTEEELDAFEAKDLFPTEAELGLKSRHEIGKEMARRVTLDVDYEDDDSGDSDYNVPVRIRNRL